MRQTMRTENRTKRTQATATSSRLDRIREKARKRENAARLAHAQAAREGKVLVKKLSMTDGDVIRVSNFVTPWHNERLLPNEYVERSKAINYITQNENVIVAEREGGETYQDGWWETEREVILWHSLMPVTEVVQKIYNYGGIETVEYHRKDLRMFWHIDDVTINVALDIIDKGGDR